MMRMLQSAEPRYPAGSTTCLEHFIRLVSPDQCVRPPSFEFTSMPVTLLHVTQAASACENSCMKTVHSLNGLRSCEFQSKDVAARKQENVSRKKPCSSLQQCMRLSDGCSAQRKGVNAAR
eukprot:163324-Prymnesium_polylepis.1